MWSEKIRIGVVLGAGGPVGHGFHAGVLHALEQVTGWDARTAELIVGTSAGAQIGALLRAGLSPRDLASRIMGQPLTAAGAAIARHYVRPDHDRPHPDHLRRMGPAAPGYLAHVARHPSHFHLGVLLAAVLPEGRVLLDAQSEGFRKLFTADWPKQKLWIPAACLETAERVVFGRTGAPATDVGNAVTASGAVPWVCVPVRVGLNRYVDGFMVGSIHVDLLIEAGLDLAIVISPLSRFPLIRTRVHRAVREVRASGLPVLLIEPSRQTSGLMGWNVLDDTRMQAVFQSAFTTTVAFLEHTAQTEPRRRLEEAGRATWTGDRR